MCSADFSSFLASACEESSQECDGPEGGGDLIDVVYAYDYDQCLYLCAAEPGCAMYTYYYPPVSQCYLFRDECDGGQMSDCGGDCMSGTPDCAEGSDHFPTCDEAGRCVGTEVGGGTSGDTPGRCQEACAEEEECRFYTFNLVTEDCYLTSTCQVEPSNDMVYGEKYCYYSEQNSTLSVKELDENIQ